jgi:hypothetical protein
MKTDRAKRPKKRPKARRPRNPCSGKRWQRWCMRSFERADREAKRAAARVNAAGATLH